MLLRDALADGLKAYGHVFNFLPDHPIGNILYVLWDLGIWCGLAYMFYLFGKGLHLLGLNVYANVVACWERYNAGVHPVLAWNWPGWWPTVIYRGGEPDVYRIPDTPIRKRLRIFGLRNRPLQYTPNMPVTLTSNSSKIVELPRFEQVAIPTARQVRLLRNGNLDALAAGLENCRITKAIWLDTFTRTHHNLPCYWVKPDDDKRKYEGIGELRIKTVHIEGDDEFEASRPNSEDTLYFVTREGDTLPTYHFWHRRGDPQPLSQLPWEGGEEEEVELAAAAGEMRRTEHRPLPESLQEQLTEADNRHIKEVMLAFEKRLLKKGGLAQIKYEMELNEPASADLMFEKYSDATLPDLPPAKLVSAARQTLARKLALDHSGREVSPLNGIEPWTRDDRRLFRRIGEGPSADKHFQKPNRKVDYWVDNDGIVRPPVPPEVADIQNLLNQEMDEAELEDEMINAIGDADSNDDEEDGDGPTGSPGLPGPDHHSSDSSDSDHGHAPGGSGETRRTGRRASESKKPDRRSWGPRETDSRRTGRPGTDHRETGRPGTTNRKETDRKVTFEGHGLASPEHIPRKVRSGAPSPRVSPPRPASSSPSRRSSLKSESSYHTASSGNSKSFESAQAGTPKPPPRRRSSSSSQKSNGVRSASVSSTGRHSAVDMTAAGAVQTPSSRKGSETSSVGNRPLRSRVGSTSSNGSKKRKRIQEEAGADADIKSSRTPEGSPTKHWFESPSTPKKPKIDDKHSSIPPASPKKKKPKKPTSPPRSPPRTKSRTEAKEKNKENDPDYVDKTPQSEPAEPALPNTPRHKSKDHSDAGFTIRKQSLDDAEALESEPEKLKKKKGDKSKGKEKALTSKSDSERSNLSSSKRSISDKDAEEGSPPPKRPKKGPKGKGKGKAEDSKSGKNKSDTSASHRAETSAAPPRGERGATSIAGDGRGRGSRTPTPSAKRKGGKKPIPASPGSKGNASGSDSSAGKTRSGHRYLSESPGRSRPRAAVRDLSMVEEEEEREEEDNTQAKGSKTPRTGASPKTKGKGDKKN